MADFFLGRANVRGVKVSSLMKSIKFSDRSWNGSATEFPKIGQFLGGAVEPPLYAHADD